jgi:hypothetical protein
MPLPREVRALVRDAQRRIDRYQRDRHTPGFVGCDFDRAYAVLHAVAARDIAPGGLFCEWGSGFGVVTCLAATLDFDAHGIEIDAELVDEARALAADFEVPAEFVRGSFIPPGGEKYLRDEHAWLSTETGGPEEEWGLAPADFDVVFAYPWPDEEDLVARLFDHYAAAGAVLITYHGGDDFRLRRKRRK